MTFGQNLFDLFVDNAQPIVLAGLGIGGIYLLYKRKLAEFIGLMVVGLIAVGFVYNPMGAKDALLNVFNQVVTGGAALGVNAVDVSLESIQLPGVQLPGIHLSGMYLSGFGF